jgi:hypothetical protein
MREGRPLADRELKIMGVTARARFAHLREDELNAVYTFLQSR